MTTTTKPRPPRARKGRRPSIEQRLQPRAVSARDGDGNGDGGIVKAYDQAPRANPFALAGAPGTAIYGGYVATRETNNTLIGATRWKTLDQLVANNVGGLGAYLRLLNLLVGKVNWRWTANPRAEKKRAVRRAEQRADFFAEVIGDMRTPWRRVVKQAASFLPRGFSLLEWQAKRRADGAIGLADIVHRPQHTVERWIRDPMTRAITGVVQRDVETGRDVPLSRGKLIYCVDDAFTDSPIGMGLLRQAVESAHRLKRYEQLEGIAFETHLGGVPVIKAPLAKLAAAYRDKQMTEAEISTILDPLEEILENHIRGRTTGYMLDSAVYEGPDRSPSSAEAFSIELLKGDSTGFAPLDLAIRRERYQMAILCGAQVLLIGEGGAGALALSRQQAEVMIWMAMSVLQDIAESLYGDLVVPLGALNGIPDDELPRPTPESLQTRDVETLAAMLVDLAAADPSGIDPAVDEVRTTAGLSPRPPREEGDEAAALPRASRPKPGEPDPGEGDDGDPGDDMNDETGDAADDDADTDDDAGEEG